MTRKHYVQIADALAKATRIAKSENKEDIHYDGPDLSAHSLAAIAAIRDDLIAIMERDNPLFDKSRFLRHIAENS